MTDHVEIILPSLPACPTCDAEAHVLTFRPAVEPDETRVLTKFTWRCPNGHQFAAAMPDLPVPTWRRTVEDLELAELPAQPAHQVQPPED